MYLCKSKWKEREERKKKEKRREDEKTIHKSITFLPVKGPDADNFA